MSSSDYVERAGRLVIDANIVIGAILGGHQGSTRRLMNRLTSARIVLMAPEELIHEVDKHLADAVARWLASRRITGQAFIAGQQDAAAGWRDIQEKIRIIPADEYRFFESTARRRVPADPDDWPYIAVALRMDCGLVTKNLAHFAGGGIPTWSIGTAALLVEDE